MVPVYNEAQNLDELNRRITGVLTDFGDPFEIIYIDDGSSDGSTDILIGFTREDPHIRVVEFNRNYGQHMAVFAGFEESRGEVVVTLDADLQNPPEEIPKLVDAVREGYDAVGGWRKDRKDSIFRKLSSYLVNRITSWIVGVKLNDYGCMLRAYSRAVVDNINRCGETSTFIPALANSFAKDIKEVEVSHSRRERGETKYSILKLFRLNFDLMTGFSLIPIQMVSIAGLLIALIGGGFGLFLLVRRLFVGPEVEGVFTLFAILFVFVGIQIFALGLIGEYIGRISMDVRRRPRYIVKNIHSNENGKN